MKPRITPTVGVTADGWVSVGVVSRAHGIQGGIKIHVWNDDTEALRAGIDVKIGARVLPVRNFSGSVLVVDDVRDRDSAEALAGQEVFVRRADFPEDEDDEGGYLVDLLGAEVFDEQGNKLGVVEGFADNSAQVLVSVLVAPDKEPVLVPFVEPIVVSAEKGRVVLKPPAGLFDEGAIE
jgi:16S rRNA processing protein RimM